MESAKKIQHARKTLVRSEEGKIEWKFFIIELNEDEMGDQRVEYKRKPLMRIHCQVLTLE